jgi:hypothetical protein
MAAAAALVVILPLEGQVVTIAIAALAALAAAGVAVEALLAAAVLAFLDAG